MIGYDRSMDCAVSSPLSADELDSVSSSSWMRGWMRCRFGGGDRDAAVVGDDSEAGSGGSAAPAAVGAGDGSTWAADGVGAAAGDVDVPPVTAMSRLARICSSDGYGCEKAPSGAPICQPGGANALKLIWLA